MSGKCEKQREEQKASGFGQKGAGVEKSFWTCALVTFRILAVLLLVFSFNNTVSANEKPVFNVDFFCGWSGYFRPMEWTPLEITVSSNLEKAFGGELTFTSQQDGLNTLNIIHDFVLEKDMPEYMPLVTKIAYTAQKCSLKLDQIDQNHKHRKTVWSQEYDVYRFISPGKTSVINEQDMLIGVVGLGKYGLLRLDRQSYSQIQRMNGIVYIGTKQPRLVPWDWTGFVSLDLLVLYDPDWLQFQEQQLKAIAEWISNGGKMLVVLGSRPPMGDNPLTKIIPFDFLDPKQVEIPKNLLYKWNLSGSNSEMVTVRPLVPKANTKDFEGDLYQDNQYLYAVGSVGFGKVGVLSFDPSEFSDMQKAHSSQFWVSCIKTILKTGSTSNNSITTQRGIEFTQDIDEFQKSQTGRQGSQYNQYNYEIARAYSLNNKVMEFLYSEIKPLSVWFVILLLGTLAVLLGPVDYKILKKIDRLPLTWLTCSFWIILFTVGAYYGVQNLRGGKMQLKVVSVLDGIKGEDAFWATHYSGLFASRSDSYELEGLKPDQWWSGIAPTQESQYYYNNEIGSRKIYCVQEDGGNLPHALPVNIWDIQCMLTEESISKVPFNADVQRKLDNNTDTITVTINNDSGSAIMQGYVLVNDNYGMEFGSVPAHSAQKFQARARRLSVWENISMSNVPQSPRIQGSYYQSNFRKESAFFAQGSIQRTQAILEYLKKGAAVVCVSYDQAPVSFGVKDRSFSTEHVQLARLVVFPNNEGTGND